MRQRLAAYLMIIVQVVALEHMLFQFDWFPVLLAFMAVFSLPPFSGPLKPIVAAAGIALAGALVWFFIRTFSQTLLPVVPYLGGYMYFVCAYMLILEMSLLNMRKKNGGVYAAFPAAATLVMAVIGLAGRHGPLDPVYHACVLAFVVLLVVFWRPDRAAEKDAQPAGARWRGRLFHAGLLALALGAAFTLSATVGVYRTGIDVAFFNLVGGMGQGTSLGFSTNARLDSVALLKLQEADEAALRVVSRRAPGYLRGRAYDEYKDGRWNVTVKDAPLPLCDETLPGVKPAPGARLYRVRHGEPPYEVLTVSPAAKLEGCLFAPAETVFVSQASTGPMGDSLGNIRAAATASTAPYEVVAAAAANDDMDPEAIARVTAVPDNLDPGVRQLAADLFQNCRTTQDKIAATIAYFRDNYQYKLGIDVPRGKDPLTWFLLERPPAHCEYFASGAAILLRLGDVPARYVNGFVAVERNAVGRYWVARNSDAHAWVEAYDNARRRWVIVEATVAEGVPGEEAAGFGMLAQVTDYATYVRQRLAVAVKAGDWPALLSGGRVLVWLLVPAGLLALRAAVKRASRRRNSATRRMRKKPTSEAKDLLRLRKRVDRKVRRCGFARRPQETICAFANRITEKEHPGLARLQLAAQWYRLYNEARFGDPSASDKVEALRSRLGNL